MRPEEIAQKHSFTRSHLVREFEYVDVFVLHCILNYSEKTTDYSIEMHVEVVTFLRKQKMPHVGMNV